MAFAGKDPQGRMADLGQSLVGGGSDSLGVGPGEEGKGRDAGEALGKASLGDS